MSITKREYSLPLPKIFLTYCTNRDKEVIAGIICGRDLFVEEEPASTDEHKGLVRFKYFKTRANPLLGADN